MKHVHRPMGTKIAGAGQRRGRRASKTRSRIESFFFGLALAAFGVVAWGIQQDRDWAETFYDWWPLLLVWVGLGKLLSRRFAGGIAMVTGGGLAFLHLRGLADFQYTWPLILVAVGVVITLDALVPEVSEDPEHATDPDAPSEAEQEQKQEVGHDPA